MVQNITMHSDAAAVFETSTTECWGLLYLGFLLAITELHTVILPQGRLTEARYGSALYPICTQSAVGYPLLLPFQIRSL